VRGRGSTFGVSRKPRQSINAARARFCHVRASASVFATNGKLFDPIFITAVTDSDGNPIDFAGTRPHFERVMDPGVAFVVTSMMQSVVEKGTGQRAKELGRPVAGKTGTTNDTHDAWFVGFTPDLLAAVWVGFDDQHKLGRGEAGAKTALPIWTDFMTKALAGQPVRDFAQPPGIVVQRVDKATGLLPAPGREVGTDSYDEVFIDGTAPTEAAPAPGQEQSADELLLGQ